MAQCLFKQPGVSAVERLEATQQDDSRQWRFARRLWQQGQFLWFLIHRSFLL
jgi:hypothetical protein